MTTERTKKILRALIDKETSQAEIARELGFTRGAINHVIHERRSTQELRDAIERILGQNFWRLRGVRH